MIETVNNGGNCVRGNNFPVAGNMCTAKVERKYLFKILDIFRPVMFKKSFDKVLQRLGRDE